MEFVPSDSMAQYTSVKAFAGTRRMLVICKVGCLTCRPDLMPSDSIRSSMPLLVSIDDDDMLMIYASRERR